MAGMKLDSDTRMEYVSGLRASKPKMPRSLVSDCWISRSERLKRNTVAPICGMPAALRTYPAMLPESFIAGAGNAAGAVNINAPSRLATNFVRPVSIKCGRPLLLLYRKVRGGGERLVAGVIHHLQSQCILAGLEGCQR